MVIVVVIMVRVLLLPFSVVSFLLSSIRKKNAAPVLALATQVRFCGSLCRTLPGAMRTIRQLSQVQLDGFPSAEPPRLWLKRADFTPSFWT